MNDDPSPPQPRPHPPRVTPGQVIVTCLLLVAAAATIALYAAPLNGPGQLVAIGVLIASGVAAMLTPLARR